MDRGSCLARSLVCCAMGLSTEKKLILISFDIRLPPVLICGYLIGYAVLLICTSLGVRGVTSPVMSWKLLFMGIAGPSFSSIRRPFSSPQLPQHCRHAVYRNDALVARVVRCRVGVYYPVVCSDVCFWVYSELQHSVRLFYWFSQSNLDGVAQKVDDTTLFCSESQ